MTDRSVESEFTPVQRRPDTVTDSSLHPKHYSGRADVRNEVFFAHPKVKSHFLAQSLLYERLVIPTNDFAIVAAIVNWMGEGIYEDALDSDALTFLRRKGFLGYGSDGLGVQEYMLEDTPQKPFRWWQRAFFGHLHEAIDLQLMHHQPSISRTTRERLVEKTIRQSEIVAYRSNDFFIKNIATESYLDVRDTPELRSTVVKFARAKGHKSGDPIDIARLPGVEHNSFQVVGSGEVQDAPDLVIRVAEVNMDLLLADFAGGTDLYVPQGSDALMKHKLLRAGYPQGRLDGFLRILTLTNIPDVRPAIESGAIDSKTVWKLRQSGKARRFRKWLAQADLESADDLVRLYVESLDQSSLMESAPARIIRFGLLTALGVSHPVVGGAIALADTLFTEKYVRGYRPKLMFNQLASLLAKEPPEGKS